jgi:Tfp pilus assembly protein PilX
MTPMNQVTDVRNSLVTSQRGAALVVALLMLLLVTVLGIGSIKVAIDQDRMAGLSRERQEMFWYSIEVADADFVRIDRCISELENQAFDAALCALQTTAPNKSINTPAGQAMIAADTVVRCNNRQASSIADCRDTVYMAKCNRFLNNPAYGASGNEPECMHFIVESTARGPDGLGRTITESIFLLTP